MLSSCTHCGAKYQLDDKMLGKKARCKACGKLFVLIPAEPEVSLQDIEPPHRGGSTAQLNPVQQQEAWSDDPLDALATAAVDSGSHMAPTRSAYAAPAAAPRGRDDEDDEGDRRQPKRMAKGAMTSMLLGITAAGLAVAGVICGIVAMVQADSNQDVLVILGLVGVAILAISAVLGMIAVSNSTSAGRAIRRARHPLSGRSEATTGTITGSAALVIVFIMVIAGGIWLSQRGGIVFEEVTVESKK